MNVDWNLIKNMIEYILFVTSIISLCFAFKSNRIAKQSNEKADVANRLSSVANDLVKQANEMLLPLTYSTDIQAVFPSGEVKGARDIPITYNIQVLTGRIQKVYLCEFFSDKVGFIPLNLEENQITFYHYPETKLNQFSFYLAYLDFTNRLVIDYYFMIPLMWGGSEFNSKNPKEKKIINSSKYPFVENGSVYGFNILTQNLVGENAYETTLQSLRDKIEEVAKSKGIQHIPPQFKSYQAYRNEIKMIQDHIKEILLPLS